MSFKFTVIKKNQILAGAVTLMLVTAGYLNYKYDPTKPYDVEVTGLIEENLGDAVLVDAHGEVKDLNLEETTQNYTISKDGTTPVFQNHTNLKEKDQNEASGNRVTTSEKVFKEIEDYFIGTRIDRTNHYAEQIESYEMILEGSNTSEAQKNKAQEEIEKINHTRNSIMIAENLIRLKGFEEVVILVNEKSINVIVEADNISSSQVAQIQSIIMNEFLVEIGNIHIINYE